MNERDSVDFELFYEFSQCLREDESSAINNEELDYSTLTLIILVDAFVALGGDANKQGTISRDKIVSVLLNDFELTLDIDVRSSDSIEIHGSIR